MTDDDARLMSEYIRHAKRALQNGDTRDAIGILDAIAAAIEGVPDEPINDEDTAPYLTAHVGAPIHLTPRTPAPSHRCACQGSAWACSFCGESCHCRYDENTIQAPQLAAA